MEENQLDELQQQAFNAWLDEQEGFGLRRERFYDDLSNGKEAVIVEWLKAAFLVGYKNAERMHTL